MTRRDAVSPELRAYVLRRDGGCVLRPEKVAVVSRLGPLGPCRGRITAAHVRDRGKGGRTSKRPPSTARHLVGACERHHLDDPVVDRPEVRDVLDAYLEDLEGPDQDDGNRPWEAIPRVRSARAMLPNASGVPAPLAPRSDEEGRNDGTR